MSSLMGKDSGALTKTPIFRATFYAGGTEVLDPVCKSCVCFTVRAMANDSDFDMLLEELNNPDSLSAVTPVSTAVLATVETPAVGGTSQPRATPPPLQGVPGGWRQPPVSPGMDSDSSSESLSSVASAKGLSSDEGSPEVPLSAVPTEPTTRLKPVGAPISRGTTYLRPVGAPIREEVPALPVQPAVQAEVYPDHSTPSSLGPVVAAVPLAAGTTVGTVLPPIVEAATGAATTALAGAEAASSLANLAGDVRAFGEQLNRFHQQAPKSAPTDLPATTPASQPDPPRLLMSDVSTHEIPATRRKEIRKTVTIGDHSIVTEGITGSALVNDQLAAPSTVNFFRHMWNQVRNNAGNFGNLDGHYNVISRISTPDYGGGVETSQEINLAAYWVIDNELTDAQRVTCTIVPGSPKSVGHIDAAKIAAFMTGGVVSERFVVSAIQPKLNIANLNCARYLSDYLTAGLPYYDNYLLYAKLAYWAMVQDVTEVMELKPAIVDFPAGNDPSFINLDDANLDYQLIGNAIEAGNIILVDRHDYSPSDLQILTWLAKPGMRISGPAEGIVPACTYVSWPAIPVTILHHGTAPSIPAATIVQPDTIYAFLARLAQYRGEWASLRKGLYTALDLIGIRYSNISGRDKDRYHFLLPSMAINSPTLALPHDYNVMLRVLNLRPALDEDAMQEAQQFMTSTALQRVNLGALYVTTLGAMSSTVLHGLNISTLCLVQWGANSPSLPPMAAALIGRLGAIGNGSVVAEPKMYSYPKRAFALMYGCTVQEDIYYQSPWMGVRGHGTTNCDIAYGDMVLAQTPRFGNLLGIDNWILVRPMEWAIACPGAKVDIKREITSVGSANSVGWRGVRGSAYYKESAEGQFPGRLVTYGAQIMNAISQDVRPGVMFKFTASAAAWTPGGVAEWTPPAATPDVGFLGTFVPLLYTYEPCSIMSYSYHQATTYAPALVGSALTARLLGRLLSWQGQVIPRVGLFLRPQVSDCPANDLLGALDSLGIFGGGQSGGIASDLVDAAGLDTVNPS